MRRRDFITLLGGTAATWPVVARAQHGEPIKRVGFLTLLSLKDEEGVLAAFQDSLRSHGLIQGKNLNLDYRSSEGDVKRLTSLAQELIALRPDVLVGGRCLRALHQHCQSFVPSSLMRSFPTYSQATGGQGAQ